MAVANAGSVKNRNIVIFGEDVNAKCILGNILASSRHKSSRRFDPRYINKRSPTVHSVRSSSRKNTKLKIIVAPLSDSPKYHGLLNDMHSYQHRFILYVVKGCSKTEDENMQAIQHLINHFGNFRTRYIPVIYRDKDQMHEPVTKHEVSFLQLFPDTQFHAPLINDDSDQTETQNILMDYMKHAYVREKTHAFNNYPNDMYLFYDRYTEQETHTHTSLTTTETASDDPVDYNDIMFSSEYDFSDDDLVLIDKACVTKSHIVRVMVVGPNGAGKTTLIKRLQREQMCCDSPRPPTEGIDIERTLIRCRIVDEKLEWEAEGAGHDFKHTLDAQKVASATEGFKEVPWTYCSFWDFAGHAAYYSTHHLFMSASVIYLLVVDLSKDLESPLEHQPDTKGIGMFQLTLLESLKFWFGSIQLHAIDSDVSICLVATHKDRIPESSLITQKLAYLCDELKVELPWFVLDNTQSKDDDILSLMEFIESSAYELADENIPVNWMQLEDSIERTKQTGISVIMFQDFMEQVHNFGFTRDQLRLFLDYHHSRGQLLFFSKENAILRRAFTESSGDSMQSTTEPDTPIFLDPMSLVQFINYILKRRPKENFAISLRIQRVAYPAEGVLDDEFFTNTLTRVASANLKEFTDHCVRELIAVHIIFKFTVAEKEFMFMPCLLRQQPPDDIIQFERATEKTSYLVIRFNTIYISQAIFHQLVAALHKYYKPFKHSVNGKERMQFYCGYISFSLSPSGLQQMQIVWKPNGIHLRISNFAQSASLNGIVKKEGITLCQEALDNTLDCLNEVLSVCRNSPDYELMVICPEHTMPPALIPYDILVEENGYLCPCEEPHGITTEMALNFWISPHTLAQSSISPAIEHNRCPTSREVARIALNVEVNMHTLAHVLKIEEDTIKTAHIICDNPNDTKMQTLKLLLEWKQENGSEATVGLLRKRLGKLIKRREGDWIRRILTEELKSETYGLPTNILQAKPGERSLSYCVSNNLLPGKVYFFFLELGLTIPEIEQAKEQNREFEKYTFELLMVWKQRNVNKATFQRLLDTANYVGMDTSPMVQYIKRDMTI